MGNQNQESEIVRRINSLARSEFELIIVDSTTGVAYQRNLDWEWAGGNLYNPLGQISQGDIQHLHPRVSIHENFWESVRDGRWVPCTTVYINPGDSEDKYNGGNQNGE